jgi:hypothetical protein
LELFGPVLAMFALPVDFAVFLGYVWYLQRSLDRCSPANRSMDPGLVWLMAIPVLGIVWQFVVNGALSRSLGREYRAWGLAGSRGWLRPLGVAKSIVDALALPHVIVAVVLFFPTADEAEASGVASGGGLLGAIYAYAFLAGGVLLLASLLLWIVYWARVEAVSGEIGRFAMRESLARSWRPFPVPVWQAAPGGPAVYPGRPAPPTHVCRRCGQMLGPERFCSRCGSPAGW